MIGGLHFYCACVMIRVVNLNKNKKTMSETFPGHAGQLDPTITQPPLNHEQAYRQELAANIVEASVGTVGMYAALELQPGEKAAIHQNLLERRPDATAEELQSLTRSGNGWGNYGERPLGYGVYGNNTANDPLHDVMQPLMRGGAGQNEALHFLDLPDGNVDVRYVFKALGYTDYSGRPAFMTMGFAIPKEGAQALLEAAQADPSFVRDVVHAQTIALGFTEDKWKRNIAPRGENPDGHTLQLVGHSPNDASAVHTESIPFNKHDRIAPEPVAVLPTQERLQPAPLATSIEQAQPMEQSPSPAGELQPNDFQAAAEADAKLILDAMEGEPAAEKLALLADSASRQMINSIRAAESDDHIALDKASAFENAYRSAYNEVLQTIVAEQGGAAALAYNEELSNEYRKAGEANGLTHDQLFPLYVQGFSADSPVQSKAYELMLMNVEFEKLKL